MPVLSKIQLPDGTTYDLHDPKLPVVTSTDNGKILQVSSGAWALGNPASGEAISTATINSILDGTFTPTS